MRVETFDSRISMGQAAAAAVAETVRALLAEQPRVRMVFAAAPSQDEFLDALSALELDWSRLDAFHMDEYLGLSSFAGYLRERLFDKVDFGEVHFIDGVGAVDGLRDFMEILGGTYTGETAAAADEAEDAARQPADAGNRAAAAVECARYANLLRGNPVDIVCLGIGENCHLAFNDPPVADFQDPFLVKVVELDLPSRMQQVHDGCFPSLEAVPTHAITLTIPALLSARHIFGVIPGTRKAKAVHHTLHSPVSVEYPSTALREHPSATLFLDKDSAQWNEE